MLIAAGADVNAEHPVDGTTLGRVQDVEIAKLLIEAGADVNRGRKTPLVNAAFAGHADLIQFLVENGAKVNDPKNPPLHWVVKPEAAAALLAAGADVKQRDETGRTVLNLSKGCYNPTADTVKLLIEAGADVNAKDPSGSAPLHQAITYGVQEGETELAKVLVAAGADVDAKDGQGNTPLSLAREELNEARNDHFSNPEWTAAKVASAETLIRLLEDAGAKDDGRTPLQQAVAAGNLDDVKRLIASGADVDATGPRQITAAHVASEEGRAEILELLLEAGARIDRPDKDRMYPLHLAANARIANVLIAHGAKVDASAEREGPTPFDAAIRAGKADVVRELLRHGARIRADEHANSLLMATYYGRQEVAEILLASDHAKALLKGFENGAPLHVAAAGGYLDTACPRYVTPEIRLGLARLMVEHGADVNARAHVGFLNNMTPLMGAAGSGHVEIVRLLLEEGADVHVADPEGTFGGETALHIATKRGHPQIVKLLLDAKADINAVTGKQHVDGRKTPLDYAKAPEVRVLLLQNGGKTAIDVIGDSQPTRKPSPSANSNRKLSPQSVLLRHSAQHFVAHQEVIRAAAHEAIRAHRSHRPLLNE
jgi:ankyrin repeat protein